ncbi:reverse transcriptase Ty1/copia-type domain-containing protein [Citrus sinensis]|nr:reverse transcriptase Ty1/copia-type domain-containing protein [Citrus sinensis]
MPRGRMKPFNEQWLWLAMSFGMLGAVIFDNVNGSFDILNKVLCKFNFSSRVTKDQPRKDIQWPMLLKLYGKCTVSQGYCLANEDEDEEDEDDGEIGSLLDIIYCQNLIIATRVPFTVSIIVQRLVTNVVLAFLSATSISANMNSVPVLNGTNFKDWKENMMILLGCMDLDLSFKHPKPDELTDDSTSEDVLYYEKWDRSNRMSLMIMKCDVPEVFKSAITDEVTSASEFLTEIQKCFTKNDKTEIGTHLASLISMKYKGKGNVREYIMEMSHLASKLKALGLDLSDDLVVHLVFISLPAQFNQFKVSYNCQKEKWNLNELISFCVQEEERLKRNLISVSVLDKSGYSCSFVNRQFSLSINFNVIGTGLLNAYNNLYLLEIVSSYNENLHFSSRDPDVCIECIKGKQTKNDYSRYDYIFLIHEKSQSLDVFKTFKAEVELQLNNRIKNVRSDRGGEYYGRYDGSAEVRPYRPYERKLDSKINQHEMIVPEEQTQQPQEPVQLRRSTRERRNVIPDDYIVFLQEHEDETGVMEDDPINFHQAMQSFNSHKWIAAMNEEYKLMQDNKVWELISLPSGAKPIGCKWIFKTKRDSNGNVERYKARLVAKGFTQKEGIDYKEIFSPVSTKDSFRTIMALVAHFDLELHQMDVKTAFLNGDIEETIHMVQPENFVLGDPKKMVCKLTKSIYRLKQASRQWYFNFYQIIISYGFETNVIDECVYHKFNGSKHIFLVLYVDDILLATNDIGILHDTKSFLSKHFDMKDLGDASFVLGIEIHRDRSRGILGLEQRNYIDKVLKSYRESYVCSSMYASRYCVHSWHVGQIFEQSRDGSLESSQTGYETVEDPTSGYIYLLAGGAISWRSTKQTLVASSTMAAEFVACYEASNQGIWLRNFVTGLRILEGVERPLKIFCDNKSAVLYSNNNRSSTKSKHIEIKFLVVKESVQSGQISIEHIGTNSMIADPLTKGLPPKVFHEHTARMGVILLEDIQI